MNGRKRTVQVKFYVTEEERKLIEEKMKLVPTSNMAAYLRKIAIDGYIIQVDHTDIKAMTAGVDGQTIDAMSQERIARLIEQLKGEQYHPYPARRTYIPKKNGKLRPLGVPSIDEKLVLEAARMILEAIYDDSFEDTSHGFRPGRICHTALRQIQNRLMLLASFPPPLPICSAFSLFPSPALPQHTVDAASHNIPCTPLCFVPDTFYETTGT